MVRSRKERCNYAYLPSENVKCGRKYPLAPRESSQLRAGKLELLPAVTTPGWIFPAKKTSLLAKVAGDFPRNCLI
ncbi:protein of unknown function [Serratia sp. Tan611]|nr:protein of unknown function [Serratia sp. Tan611]